MEPPEHSGAENAPATAGPLKREVPAVEAAFAPPGVLHLACYNAVRCVVGLLLRIVFRYEVRGAERIPAQGPVVLAANHASFIDPLFLSLCTGRLVQYLMYASFYRSAARPLFRFFCTVPVDEHDYLGALKTGVKLLERGAVVGVFPEGAVSHDGRLLTARPGALFLAQRAGAVLIPVTLAGNHAALPRGAWFPRFRKVVVQVGEPLRIPPTASRREIQRQLTAVMETFAAHLGQVYPGLERAPRILPDGRMVEAPPQGMPPPDGPAAETPAGG